MGGAAVIVVCGSERAEQHEQSISQSVRRRGAVLRQDCVVRCAAGAALTTLVVITPALLPPSAAKPVTTHSWCMQRQSDVAHTRAVLSSEQVSRNAPSGEKASPRTGPSCEASEASTAPDLGPARETPRQRGLFVGGQQRFRRFCDSARCPAHQPPWGSCTTAADFDAADDARHCCCWLCCSSCSSCWCITYLCRRSLAAIQTKRSGRGCCNTSAAAAASSADISAHLTSTTRHRRPAATATRCPCTAIERVVGSWAGLQAVGCCCLLRRLPMVAVFVLWREKRRGKRERRR